MRLPVLLGLFSVISSITFAAPPALPSQVVTVAPMKTSIYIGSVRLNTSDFVWNGQGFAATYEAKVVPWIFWGESGHITIQLPAETLEKLARGETVEFTGDAVNHKNKPRPVTGRAQPSSPTEGKIKVRINADGVELIFNSTYEFKPMPGPDKPTDVT